MATDPGPPVGDGSPSSLTGTDRQQDNRARVAAFVHSAGFSGDALRTALAVAYAESSWKFDAKGGPNSNGTYDYGLFQINDVHKPTAAEKTDPVANAQRAFKIYQAAGNKFTPWSAYNSGAYKKHIGLADNAIKELQAKGPEWERKTVAEGGGSIVTAGEVVSDAAAAPANAVMATVGKFLGMWYAVVIGITLIVIGFVLLGRGAANDFLGKTVREFTKQQKAAKKPVKAAPAPKEAKKVRTIEERAKDSLDYVEARATLKAERKAAADKAEAEKFLSEFRARKAKEHAALGIKR